jgi:hypothetical protein
VGKLNDHLDEGIELAFKLLLFLLILGFSGAIVSAAIEELTKDESETLVNPTTYIVPFRNDRIKNPTP